MSRSATPTVRLVSWLTSKWPRKPDQVFVFHQESPDVVGHKYADLAEKLAFAVLRLKSWQETHAYSASAMAQSSEVKKTLESVERNLQQAQGTDQVDQKGLFVQLAEIQLSSLHQMLDVLYQHLPTE